MNISKWMDTFLNHLCVLFFFVTLFLISWTDSRVQALRYRCVKVSNSGGKKYFKKSNQSKKLRQKQKKKIFTTKKRFAFHSYPFNSKLNATKTFQIPFLSTNRFVRYSVNDTLKWCSRLKVMFSHEIHLIFISFYLYLILDRRRVGSRIITPFFVILETGEYL